MNNKTKVYVGMSGGVDSSLAAALLVEKGYEVIGVFMKNWTQDLPSMKCPWSNDLADAKRVAVKLGIDFKVFDFENEYKQKVVDYMIDEYKNGRTPNPDIMCNQEIKFKLFLESALADGADLIATGHYARVIHKTDNLSITSSSLLHAELNQGFSTLLNSDFRVSDDETEKLSAHLGVLRKAIDENKDQTYFLYRITGEALDKTLFPIGEFTKATVRKMAAERSLSTAVKKDSQGICFVGQVGIRDFLGQYVDSIPGNIIDKKTGKTLGKHSGAIFYTLGQRHGLDIGGGLPYYVISKDMAKNEVYVTTDLNDETLWRKSIDLNNVHWINDKPIQGKYHARVRHRAALIDVELEFVENNVKLELANTQRAIAAGQSIVIYDSNICLGGGIVV